MNVPRFRTRSPGARTPILGVAIGAGVAAVTGLLLVHMATEIDAGPPSVPPAGLELWTAEALDAAGQVQSAVQICTDPVVRDGFRRALPQINGQACLVVGQPAARDDLFAARCVAGGQKYSVNASRTGDVVDGEFTVRVRIRPLYVDHPGALQVLRYRKVGACPPGSRVGGSVDRRTGRTYDALDTRAG